MSDKNENTTPDVSWMWNVSGSESSKIMDYNCLIEERVLANQLNRACETGFRLALRKLEDLNIISMGDIDRKHTQQDLDKWEKEFGKN